MHNLLKAEKIKASIPAELWKLIPSLHILNKIDSTNSYVLQQAKAGASSGFTCLAEEQTAGRGRLGRHWVSPYASHLYLSMLWQFNTGQAAITGLSLAISIAIVKALEQIGITENLGLKWPNDIYWRKSKLAGVLVETRCGRMDKKNPATCISAVIGIGLNVHMPQGFAASIKQPWTDLYQILGTTADRNHIAGLLMRELLLLLPNFAEFGLANFLADWQALDIYYASPLTLRTAKAQYSGIAQGINTKGELILACDDDIIRHFASAEKISA